jgi:pyridoxamine 5'-phosphate oxidase
MATVTELREEDAGLDPFALFRRWFAEAVSANLALPEAMTLATATSNGVPSARVVLLRGFDEAGFVFFTNYQSRKGRELAENPRASLLVHWPELGRQLRIEGGVERVSAEESDSYFRTRPRGNQLAAWISPQSEVISDRQTLLDKVQQLAMQYPGDVPRPPFWGGYRVRPQVIEFWQTRENRLHDRLRYRQTSAGWVRERLAP